MNFDEIVIELGKVSETTFGGLGQLCEGDPSDPIQADFVNGEPCS